MPATLAHFAQGIKLRASACFTKAPHQTLVENAKFRHITATRSRTKFQRAKTLTLNFRRAAKKDKLDFYRERLSIFYGHKQNWAAIRGDHGSQYPVRGRMAIDHCSCNRAPKESTGTLDFRHRLPHSLHSHHDERLRWKPLDIDTWKDDLGRILRPCELGAKRLKALMQVG
eukprot:4446358-Amphidinium_carterae.1